MSDLTSYARHVVDDADIAAVGAVLRSDWLTTGPVVEEFEHAFARVAGAGHAVVVSSATAALHLAALALDLRPGDAVIVPTVTFLATANAMRLAGAEVVFADVDPDTGLMHAEHLAAAIAAAPSALNLRAVAPVYLIGQCPPVEPLCAVAGEHHLTVVADACHALGADVLTAGATPRPVGNGRDAAMSVFSLHPAKTIAMGEGGVVTTDDPALAQRVRQLRNHGITKPAGADPWVYAMHEIGLNYRASAIHCALALSQLPKLDEFVATRRRLRDHYVDRLAPLAPHVRPVPTVPGCDPAWHLSVALIDFPAAGTTRAQLMAALAAAGIGTQVHYIPVHQQPYYAARYGAKHLPGAQAYYDRCLSLPLFASMTEADVDRVVDALAENLDP